MGCGRSSTTAVIQDNSANSHNPPAASSRSSTQASKSEGKEPKANFFANYRLSHILGTGAFAQVRIAIDIQTGKEWAVKIVDLRKKEYDIAQQGKAFQVLPNPNTGTCGTMLDPILKASCEEEFHMLKRLTSCSDVMHVKECFIDDLFFYMVMERCEGTLLHCLERLETYTERQLSIIMRGVLSALMFVHKLGIVHRDVKPDNVLCSVHLDSKLCDFGFAQYLPKKSKTLKGVFGTAPFMSPEMLAGKAYDTRTDIWSLASTMYVLGLGSFPYVAKNNQSKTMKAAILKGDPAPNFTCVLPDLTLSPLLLDFVQHLLERDPQLRPSASKAWEHESMRNLDRTSSTSASPFWKDSDRSSLPSLKPLLSCAKRVGAFNLRANTHGDDSGEISTLLHAKAIPPSPLVTSKIIGAASDGNNQCQKQPPSGKTSLSMQKVGSQGSADGGGLMESLQSNLVVPTHSWCSGRSGFSPQEDGSHIGSDLFSSQRFSHFKSSPRASERVSPRISHQSSNSSSKDPDNERLKVPNSVDGEQSLTPSLSFCSFHSKGSTHSASSLRPCDSADDGSKSGQHLFPKRESGASKTSSLLNVPAPEDTTIVTRGKDKGCTRQRNQSTGSKDFLHINNNRCSKNDMPETESFSGPSIIRLSKGSKADTSDTESYLGPSCSPSMIRSSKTSDTESFLGPSMIRSSKCSKTDASDTTRHSKTTITDTSDVGRMSHDDEPNPNEALPDSHIIELNPDEISNSSRSTSPSVEVLPTS